MQERRLHLEILADGSYRTMSDEDAWWYGYAARYAEYTHWNPGAGEYLCERHWDEY